MNVTMNNMEEVADELNGFFAILAVGIFDLIHDYHNQPH